MARPLTSKTKREKVKKSLEDALTENNLRGQVYESRIEQYMRFYDSLSYINERITTLKQEANPDDKLILNLVSEARRVDNQMLETEKYFGFRPVEDSGAKDVPL